MKKEDFERLKAKLGDEFELLNVDHEDNEKYYVIAKKKDIWEGAEFAEYIGEKPAYFTSGKVYKIFGRDKITFIDDVSSYPDHNYSHDGLKKHFKPSTEKAYIEQLKKEAFERFGEINEGDRFDRAGLGYSEGQIHFIPNSNYEKGFTYYKSDDRLYFDNLVIYKQGKWATKLKERVKVKFDGGNLQSKEFYFEYNELTEKRMREIGCFKVGEFLASKLEAYLNGEIE